jgi:hypothetical protein
VPGVSVPITTLKLVVSLAARDGLVSLRNRRQSGSVACIATRRGLPNFQRRHKGVDFRLIGRPKDFERVSEPANFKASRDDGPQIQKTWKKLRLFCLRSRHVFLSSPATHPGARDWAKRAGTRPMNGHAIFESYQIGHRIWRELLAHHSTDRDTRGRAL